MSVIINVIGKPFINEPIIPGQNNKGKNGAKVVIVPASTGRNTSPAAFLAAVLIGTFPFAKILCVFSITTIASSTTIPNPSKKANNTIKFILMPNKLKTIKAINIESGTDKPTNIASVAPIKNINTMVTRINPIIMVLIKSATCVLVKVEVSPVTVTSTSVGISFFSSSTKSALILSDASIKFSPLFLITFNVITFLPSKRAKLSCSLKSSFISAISFK